MSASAPHDLSRRAAPVQPRPHLFLRKRMALAAVAAAAFVFTPATWAAQPANPQAEQAKVIRHAKGRLLIQPRAGLSDQELDRILAPHGGRRGGVIRQINVHIVELPAKAIEMQVANALRGNSHLKFVELDMALDPTLTVNDPYFGSSWHLSNVKAPAAWDVKTGSGITIAILDTGVDGNHSDLAAQMVAGRNMFDGTANTADVQGHGTSMAGVAAAVANNSAGSAGVAFNSKIMPVRVADANAYAYYSTIAQGITWAADNGARVASVSFQGATGSSSIASAAQYMRNKGGVVVASSGNTGVVESYAPSDYITTVSATDSGSNVTSFSSYGPFVDVAAPGVGIYTTAVGGGYKTSSGTSPATPLVGAIYALMMSANPTLAPATLDNILFTTTTDINTAGKDDKSGWGLVNAAAAVTKAVQTVAADTSAPSVSIGSPGGGTKVNGLVNVSVGATDNTGVSRVDLYVNGSLFASDTTAPFGFTWDATKVADGPATLVAKAVDAAGNVGTSGSVGVTVANDTTPPTPTISNPTNGAVLSGTVTVSATATDDNKVASMSLLIDGKEVAKSLSSSLSYSWNTGSTTTKTKGGKKTSSSTTGGTTRSVQVIALDPAGNKGTQSISVTTQ